MFGAKTAAFDVPPSCSPDGAAVLLPVAAETPETVDDGNVDLKVVDPVAVAAADALRVDPVAVAAVPA